MSTILKVTTPFTPDQADSLNAYQASGVFHEYTCGNDRCPAQGSLEARADGWHCLSCDYRQDWAHEFTADWSWQDGLA